MQLWSSHERVRAQQLITQRLPREVYFNSMTLSPQRDSPTQLLALQHVL